MRGWKGFEMKVKSLDFRYTDISNPVSNVTLDEQYILSLSFFFYQLDI